MTEISGYDRCFGGNTFFLELKDGKFMYTGGNLVSTFETEDKIVTYISNMGNNMIAYPIGVGERNTCFFSCHSTIMRKENIEEVDLLRTTDDSLDPCDSQVSKVE